MCCHFHYTALVEGTRTNIEVRVQPVAAVVKIMMAHLEYLGYIFTFKHCFTTALGFQCKSVSNKESCMYYNLYMKCDNTSLVHKILKVCGLKQ